MSEQALIKRYFSRHQSDCDAVVLGVGDDAAVVEPHSTRIAITMDTLNVNQHFYSDHPPDHLGHKSLAVSISDIAAMGAVPKWACLSLSLPDIDHAWLKRFSAGLYELADQHKIKIVGGDLVKGPLSITLQLIAQMHTTPLLRSACKIDDLIYVTGCLGDAAVGLCLLKDQTLEVKPQHREYFLSKLTRPEARLDASKLLPGYSQAAIDLSDGLLMDLQRMLTMSQTGAILNVEQIPLSKPMQNYIYKNIDMEVILNGGEDYQLLFTIPAQQQKKLEEKFGSAGIAVSNIGKIVNGNGIQLMHAGKKIELPAEFGFDHFNEAHAN